MSCRLPQLQSVRTRERFPQLCAIKRLPKLQAVRSRGWPTNGAAQSVAEGARRSSADGVLTMSTPGWLAQKTEIRHPITPGTPPGTGTNSRRKMGHHASQDQTGTTPKALNSTAHPGSSAAEGLFLRRRRFTTRSRTGTPAGVASVSYDPLSAETRSPTPGPARPRCLGRVPAIESRPFPISGSCQG